MDPDTSKAHFEGSLSIGGRLFGLKWIIAEEYLPAVSTHKGKASGFPNNNASNNFLYSYGHLVAEIKMIIPSLFADNYFIIHAGNNPFSLMVILNAIGL